MFSVPRSNPERYRTGDEYRTLDIAICHEKKAWPGFLEAFRTFFLALRIARAFERDWDIRTRDGTNLIKHALGAGGGCSLTVPGNDVA
ncbi:hypothetical protein FKO01_05650 [Mesorhizobium sp. B2-3-3]|nr:hypothetical protein FKO01_05650 [Mesorhizobium sp. B2-3-3]